MELVGDRDLMRLSAEKRGPDGLARYRAEHNTSIDGLPGLVDTELVPTQPTSG
jgi:hypothetical protein